MLPWTTLELLQGMTEALTFLRAMMTHEPLGVDARIAAAQAFVRGAETYMLITQHADLAEKVDDLGRSVDELKAERRVERGGPRGLH